MQPDPHENENEEPASHCDFVRVISHLSLRKVHTLDSVGHLANRVELPTGIESTVVIKRTDDRSMKRPVPPRSFIWHEHSGADHAPAISPEPCRELMICPRLVPACTVHVHPVLSTVHTVRYGTVQVLRPCVNYHVYLICPYFRDTPPFHQTGGRKCVFDRRWIEFEPKDGPVEAHRRMAATSHRPCDGTDGQVRCCIFRIPPCSRDCRYRDSPGRAS